MIILSPSIKKIKRIRNISTALTSLTSDVREEAVTSDVMAKFRTVARLLRDFDWGQVEGGAKFGYNHRGDIATAIFCAHRPLSIHMGAWGPISSFPRLAIIWGVIDSAGRVFTRGRLKAIAIL